MEHLDLKLYSVSQAAKLLGISRSSVNKLIEESRIGIIQINSRHKIPHYELERFLRENIVKKTVVNSDDDIDGFIRPSKDPDKNKPIVDDQLFINIRNEVINGKRI